MGLILESKTKEVGIGHALVDGLKACNNSNVCNAPDGGVLSLCVDKGDRYGGCDGFVVYLNSFILVSVSS